jgi:hypothetical protein
LTQDEEKTIIESLKILEGQKRKLLSLIKKPKPQDDEADKGGKDV